MIEHLPHKCISTAAQAELLRAVNMLVKRQLSLSCSPISMKNWRAAQAELPIINVLKSTFGSTIKINTSYNQLNISTLDGHNCTERWAPNEEPPIPTGPT